ncbi:MAG TPA: hypothetical protein VH597_09110 [Verrucomicrobiae bacterium]|jgi:hypothetical protein|nr:hypothetical protein [Verrucomicrobiae bacterium]
MRWFKSIAWTALGSWLLQSLMFIMLFASAFERIVVQCFVSLGARQPEASAFLSGTMKILAWPVHPLFPSAWADATFVQAILLLGLNSLIWGGVLGTIWFFLRRMRGGRGVERPS